MGPHLDFVNSWSGTAGRGVDDPTYLLFFDHINDVRTSIRDPEDGPTVDARLSQHGTRTACGVDRKSELTQLSCIVNDLLFILVTYAEKDIAR